MKKGTPSLQQQFHREVLGLYDRCASLGFRPVLLRRFIVLNCGVAAAPMQVTNVQKQAYRPAPPTQRSVPTRAVPQVVGNTALAQDDWQEF